MSDPFAETEHRPWPLPERPWVMYQRWESLLFAHYQVPAEVLRARVPATLALEQFDGSAWLSITPLLVASVRARGLPPLPGVSSFPELNVRTYVTFGGRPGVFFLSLDAASWAAVAGARTLYHLPYYRAAMRLRRFPAGAYHYFSRRVQGGASGPAEFRARYRPLGLVHRSAPGSLDHWLSERYCLYAAAGERIYRTEIQHARWPLQDAEAAIDRNTMAEAAGVPLGLRPDRLAFSSRLDVAVWWPERVA